MEEELEAYFRQMMKFYLIENLKLKPSITENGYELSIFVEDVEIDTVLLPYNELD